MEKLIFHWYDNPNDSQILLYPKPSEKLALMIKKRYGSNSDIIKNFNGIRFLYKLRKNKPLAIKTLKRVLYSLDLNYNICNSYVNKYGVKKPFDLNFPINLNKYESAILVAAFMSDGNNQPEHPFYANTDFLGHKILKTVRSFIPDIPWEIRNDKLRFHPILSRLLLKLGVPIGNKTIINPHIPKFIHKNKKFMKAYLTQVFDDEGYAPKRASRKMVLGRSVALKNLPEKFVSTLIYNKKIYFNSLPENIKKIVNKQPPNLIKEEHQLLKKFGVKSALRCRGLCKYLETISVDWVIEIYGKENIERFNKEIGFSHPDKIKQINEYIKGYKLK